MPGKAWTYASRKREYGALVAIEYRWTEGRDDRLPEMAADLVRRQVAVIVTPGSITAALAAKAATRTIPIVFTSGIDPVNSGLVSNFNRPSGNLTGIYDLSNDLAAKRLGMLHELVPNVPAVTLLVNPRDPIVAESTTKEVETAARALGLQLQILTASTNSDLHTAFATLVQHKAGSAPRQPRRILYESARSTCHARGTPCHSRDLYVQVGGLMSYGRNIADTWHRAGVYAGRLLKGEKPADLPIMLSTKFEFVINLTTAKVLGLTFPPGLLALADEVIE
jgi:ABC-type uncharacterized transport system substrate-binding protein